MRSTIVKHELMVGSFIAVCALLAAGAVMKRTREKGLLDTQKVTFVVEDGSGLQTGSPVVMRGIQVGQIGDVKLTDDNQVEVRCDIAPRFAKHITTDAVAKLVEPPLIGNTKVEIDPGVSTAEVGRNQRLKTKKEGNFLSRIEGIEQRVEGVIAKIDSLVTVATRTISTIDRVATKIDKGKGMVGSLINDAQIAKDAKAAIKELRDVARSVREGEGALALAINDKGFANDLRSTVKDVRSITKDVQAGKGTVGKLFKDSKLLDESTDLVKDVRRSLAKLNELNEQAKHSVAKVQKLLDTTTGAVKKVEGLVGSADKVTAEMADTLRRINQGKGTVAALLNDPAIYLETKSLIKELRESVEDLREQAPINSFLGVVFSAF